MKFKAIFFSDLFNTLIIFLNLKSIIKIDDFESIKKINNWGIELILEIMLKIKKLPYWFGYMRINNSLL